MKKTDGEKRKQGEGENGSSAFSNFPPLPVFLFHQAADRRTWDVIVVGAGPAGAMAAYELARRSLRVLLVDKSAFPRPKVCGCCLNAQALALLQARGLGHLIDEQGAVPLRQVVLAAEGHRAVIPLPTGVAISREAFDMGLINAAVENGATFLPNTLATLADIAPSYRKVILRSNGPQREVEAPVILAADGLGGMLSRPDTSNKKVRNQGKAAKAWHPKDSFCSSRIGAAIILESVPAFYQSEMIYMACGTGGYVGQVRLEDGRLNMAAAFDLKALQKIGHPGRLASRILDEAGFPPVPHVVDLPWKGTPRLTHHAGTLAAERLFMLGDAASFVEPFTGEGIAWALQSGVAVAPLAKQGVDAWDSDLEKKWTATYHRVVERRQITCRLAAAVLRHPRLTTLALRMLAVLPFLSRPVLHQLNARHSIRTGSYS
jgi:flavin-dependent dehydrogenase